MVAAGDLTARSSAPAVQESGGPRRTPGGMDAVDLSKAEGMPILARIVVPLTAVEREAIGEVRGMSREHCAVPLPPAARVVQAERTEGAWVVWYVEKVDAI